MVMDLDTIWKLACTTCLTYGQRYQCLSGCLNFSQKVLIFKTYGSVNNWPKNISTWFKKKKSEPTTVCFSLLHAIIIKGKWTSLDCCLGFRPPWLSLTLCAQLGVGMIWGQGLPWRLGGKEPTCDAGDAGSIPGLRRSSGEGNGNPLHSSIPAWEIPRVEEPGRLQSMELQKSQTWLNN